jgi:class 3 adenylate cyclase
MPNRGRGSGVPRHSTQSQCSPPLASRECQVVVAAPEIQYARSADGTNLAYQVSGSGPLELVFLHVAYPIDLLSEDPGFDRFRRRLGSLSRAVWFDARGNGASEGQALDGQREEIFDADFFAVLDAVGFERPVVVAEGWPGLRAIRFSAAHPERVDSLVLINSYAHGLRDTDYPLGVPPGAVEGIIEAARQHWGTTEAAAQNLQILAPSRADDERFRAWFARAARFSGGPDLVADMMRAGYEDDVRPLLPALSVPTLVLHREGDRYVDVGMGRYLAEHIPGARFVAVPGADHLFFVGDTDALVDEIEEFLTGARSGAEGEVMMVAVLFTDIVASTEHQLKVGPRAWSRLSDQHDAMVRSALVRNRGREVKTMGDGFLATFNSTGGALRCAEAILAGATDLELELRVGLHTGEVEVRGDDIAGLAVTIAKRICDVASAGTVLVSETVRSNMVSSGLEFKSQGDYELKGLPGNWRLYTVATSS